MTLNIPNDLNITMDCRLLMTLKICYDPKHPL